MKKDPDFDHGHVGGGHGGEETAQTGGGSAQSDGAAKMSQRAVRWDSKDKDQGT